MRIPTFLLLSSVLLFACSKKNDSVNNNGNPGGNGNGGDPPVTDTVVGKRGTSFSTNSTNGTWYGNVAALKSHWFYTWGTTLPFLQSPSNTEFVSMFWGRGNVTADNIAYVKARAAEGKVKYVLGFNEPDLPDQSNMTVDQALALWPQLESIGLPLGSPACAWPTVDWFKEFMTKAKAQGRRVDFICVHMYVGTDDQHFIGVLADLYNTYKLPIWVTEFATAWNDAKKMSDNPYSPQTVQAFMQRLIPKLDSVSYVKRYAWFSGDPKSPQLWSSALVDANGNLTVLGQWYADYKPNAKSGK